MCVCVVCCICRLTLLTTKSSSQYLCTKLGARKSSTLVSVLHFYVTAYTVEREGLGKAMQPVSSNPQR